MKKWVVPEHSNKAVQRASRVIGKGTATSEESQAARDILSNYPPGSRVPAERGHCDCPSARAQREPKCRRG